MPQNAVPPAGLPSDPKDSGARIDQNADAASAVPVSFEQAIGELEDLVHGMEGGEFSLEQSLSAYKRGATLVAFCRRSLADARQQVKILEGDLLKTFELDQAVGPGEAD